MLRFWPVSRRNRQKESIRKSSTWVRTQKEGCAGKFLCLTIGYYHLEEGTATKKYPQNGRAGSMWCIFLISDWCEEDSPLWVVPSPRLVVLGSVRKQAEQGMRSKPVCSTSPWFLHQLLPLRTQPCWPFPSDGLWFWTYKQNKPFPPPLTFCLWSFMAEIEA